MLEENVICCRSEVGITIGLIDSLIAIARVLKDRPLDDPNIIEALTDLQEDEDIQRLLSQK